MTFLLLNANALQLQVSNESEETMNPMSRETS
eukprot:CAMPEP_0116151226 /NCGR_PEP_ID=MMETSP0329-20121206/19979_1 /TAXON_ID=697910 /ORGANISM="Pseudo-nitzschia arenysensis, Strain B593" /LENGTH=31 /DNA_ID= /DNA_START= /DNA_END= /DNA_ORIENTATION=